MAAKRLFTSKDQERIAAAVGKAESRTSGEIVPVIIGRSSGYRTSLWKAAMIGVLPGLAVHEWLLFGGDTWGRPVWMDGQILPLMMIAGAVITALLVNYVPYLQRLLIPERDMVRAVHARAKESFLDSEVFLTRERTGILLLVSLFEHRVEVLGDTGINAKVEPEDWADVIADVVSGIRSGDPVSGLESAILRCGALLEKAGVERRDDDQNELSDAPQIL